MKHKSNQIKLTIATMCVICIFVVSQVAELVDVTEAGTRQVLMYKVPAKASGNAEMVVRIIIPFWLKLDC